MKQSFISKGKEKEFWPNSASDFCTLQAFEIYSFNFYSKNMIY